MLHALLCAVSFNPVGVRGDWPMLQHVLLCAASLAVFNHNNREVCSARSLTRLTLRLGLSYLPITYLPACLPACLPARSPPSASLFPLQLRPRPPPRLWPSLLVEQPLLPPVLLHQCWPGVAVWLRHRLQLVLWHRMVQPLRSQLHR